MRQDAPKGVNPRPAAFRLVFIAHSEPRESDGEALSALSDAGIAPQPAHLAYTPPAALQAAGDAAVAHSVLPSCTSNFSGGGSFQKPTTLRWRRRFNCPPSRRHPYADGGFFLLEFVARVRFRARVPSCGFVGFPILGNCISPSRLPQQKSQWWPTMGKSQHSRRYRQVLKALRDARKRAGLTQLDVARKLGTYASFVSKCESGERRIDVVELADFCRLYGISLMAFLRPLGLD